MQSHLNQLVAALAASWRSGRPFSCEEATRLAPRDAAEAYAVQDAVAAELGWFPGGRPRVWKMGAADRSAEPGASPIADAALLPGPAQLPAHGHVMSGLEGELAVVLARPLAPGCSHAEAAAAIGEIYAAIEVCDQRAEGGDALPLLFRLADRQVNRCLILGDRITGPWREAYANLEVSLEMDGEILHRGRGGHPLGDPLYLLPWLATHVAGRGVPGGLAAGDLITTGSWTGVHRARPGERVVVRFGGLGRVETALARAG